MAAAVSVSGAPGLGFASDQIAPQPNKAPQYEAASYVEPVSVSLLSGVDAISWQTVDITSTAAGGGSNGPLNSLGEKSAGVQPHGALPGYQQLSEAGAKTTTQVNSFGVVLGQAQGALGVLPGNIQLIHPVTSRHITSPYGWRNNPTGAGAQIHIGQDYAISCGSPVYASADGVVVQSAWAGHSGMRVTIDHGSSVRTGYSHNSRLIAQVGDVVKQGQVIALSGTTGNSTGCHVHFEVIINGRWNDPRNFLPGVSGQPNPMIDSRRTTVAAEQIRNSGAARSAGNGAADFPARWASGTRTHAPDPTSTTQHKAVTAPKPEPQEVVKPAATKPKPAPKKATPQTKPAPLPESKPAPKPQTKPAPKPQTKPAPKPQTKPAPKPQTKPAPLPESKPAPTTQPAPKPQTKPGNTPEPTTQVPQVDPKPTPAPETKPAPTTPVPEEKTDDTTPSLESSVDTTLPDTEGSSSSSGQTTETVEPEVESEKPAVSEPELKADTKVPESVKTESAATEPSKTSAAKPAPKAAVAEPSAKPVVKTEAKTAPTPQTQKAKATAQVKPGSDETAKESEAPAKKAAATKPRPAVLTEAAAEAATDELTEAGVAEDKAKPANAEPTVSKVKVKKSADARVKTKAIKPKSAP